MSRVPRTRANPQDPRSIVKQLDEAVRVVDQFIEFGEPQDPNDPSSSKLAGASGTGAHNGTTSNILGSWVEVSITDLTAPFTCTHNLFAGDPEYVVPVAGSPNVRWLLFAAQHDGEEMNPWDDVRGQWEPDPTTPPGVSTVSGMHFWAFDGAGADESIWFSVQMPHSYKEGSDIEPHVHWFPTDNSTGNVRWVLRYSWAEAGVAFPGGTDLVATTPSVGGTGPGQAYVHSITPFSTISGTGKGISSVLMGTLTRTSSNAADTYNNQDAGFLEIDFHFQKDSHGSDQEFSKSAGFGPSVGPVSVDFQDRDTVAANSIDLRAHGIDQRTVDVSHPLKLTLFFIRATQ